MKKLILAAIMLLPFLASNAQNNGQNDTTDAIILHYVGYSAGNYVVDIKNIQTCPSGNMRFEWFSNDTIILNVLSGETRTVLLPGTPSPLLSIKAKPDFACPTFSVGWAEVFSPATLAATGMESFYVTARDGKFNFTWTTLTETNSSHFVIEKSYNGKDWFTAGIIASKAPQGNSSSPISYVHSMDINPKNYSGFKVQPLLILAIILLIATVIGRIAEKRIISTMAGICLIITVVSCKKNTLEDELSKKQTVQFRLLNVDTDDTVHDYPNVRTLKI